MPAAPEWVPSSLSGMLGGGGEAPRQQTFLQSISTRASNPLASVRENSSGLATVTGMHNHSLCPSLTWKQRLMGCAWCFIIGVVLSILGFLSWWTGHTAQFAVTYTLGNLVSLASTGFLIGPARQCRQMMKAKRRIATLIYFSMMILTLIVAWNRFKWPLILLCIILQFSALVWYIASYIPFGQKLISKILGRVTDF